MNENNISSKEKWLLIIISVLISMGIWLFVSHSTNPEIEKTFKNVPIAYHFEAKMKEGSLLSNKLIIMGEYPKQTDITIKGRRNDLISLRKEDIGLIVDLSEATPGTKLYAPEVRLPKSGFIATYVKDDDISLDIEELVQKKVDIKVESLGSLPPDTTVHFKLSKSDVLVSGAKSEMEKLKSVVAVVNLPDLKHNETRSAKLEILTNEENGMKPSLSLAFDEVSISAEFKKLKKVGISYSFGKSLPPEYELLSTKLSKDEITLEGSEEALEKIKSLGTKPLDLSKLMSLGVHTLKFDFILPEGVEIADQDLPYLVVELDKKVIRSFDISNAQLIFERLKSGYRVEVLNQKGALVFLEGRSTLLDKVNEKKLKLIIDLQDLEEGVHQIFYEIDGLSKELKVYDYSNVLELNIQKVSE